MRRLIATVHVTLDGVMGEPEDSSYQFVEAEGDRHTVDELRAAGALLMGRVTHEGFVGYWPTSADPEAIT